MTKYQILEKFNEITGKWDSWPFAIEQFAKRLTKKECSCLLNLAETGYCEFRLFNTHGYALDHSYNRLWIYDHRNAAA